MCMLQNGHGLVEPINARSMHDAAATAAMTATAAHPRVERRRRLTPAALAISNQKVARAYSPIVIAGDGGPSESVIEAARNAYYKGFVAEAIDHPVEGLDEIFGRKLRRLAAARLAL